MVRHAGECESRRYMAGVRRVLVPRTFCVFAMMRRLDGAEFAVQDVCHVCRMWRSSACSGKGNAEAYVVDIMATSLFLGKPLVNKCPWIEDGRHRVGIDMSEGEAARCFKQGGHGSVWNWSRIYSKILRKRWI